MILDYLSIIMVFVGATILLLSFPPAIKISKNFKGWVHDKWLITIYLMGLFIVGYISFDIILIINFKFPIKFVTALVFLGGAVFVFIIMNVFRDNITTLQKIEDELFERTRHAELGAEIGAAFVKHGDLRSQLQLCTESVVKNLDAAFARIWVLDEEDEDILRLMASAGMYTRLDGNHSIKKIGELKIGIIAKEKKPHLTNAVIGDPMITDQEWAIREGIIGFAGHPFVLLDRVVGVMAMFSKKPLQEDALKALASISDEITLGIEQKKAEMALRESEERYRNLFENSTDFVYTLDLNGNFTDVNKAAENLTGYTKNELIGMNYRGYIVEANHVGIFEGFNRVFNTGKPLKDFPLEVIIKDGSTRYFETCVSLLKKGNQIIGFQGSSRDITERTQAEEALRESEEKFRLLFNSSNDSIFVHQPSKEGKPNKFIEVNEIASKVYGYTREEFLQLTPADLMPQEDRGKARELIKSIITKGHDIFEIVHKTKEGKYFPVEASAFLFEFQGKPTVLSIIRDITERKETEKALAKGKNQLSSLVNNLIDSIILTDKTGTIKFVNNSACELFGKEKYLLINTPIGLSTDMDDLLEIEINSPDGKNRYAEAISRMIDWDGEPSYLISLRDITVRKHAMEEREKMAVQLQQSQKLESIGRLTGGIAHDFNNMLSVILGYGEDILNNLSEKDPLFESAKEIIEAGKRSVELTRQLLAFSRRQTLQPEVLNLSLVVTNLEKMLRRLIGEDIDLITKFAEEPDFVKVDPGQIEQVIMNLAVNARDAMPDGGKLTIETTSIELDEQYAATHVAVIPGKYVILSITDSGCGIDEKTRSQIFEPFFTTKEKGKGTGLGLSTVYGIIKQSGGFIWVYSEPGQGTAFKIYLPKTKDKLSETRASAADDSIYGKGELIFVVEDEPSFRKLCERMLKLLNYNVVAASNGEEALFMVDEKKLCPDLILTDIIMPGMSGKVLVERLTKILPDLKVVYMSGYTDNAIVHQGILDPEIPFIQKPFSKDKLGKAIRSVLDET